MSINYPQRYDDDFLNTIKTVIDHVNIHGKTIQDLVADGQLTDAQYAQLITVINGHLKSGEVDRNALNPTLRAEVDKIRNKIDKGDVSVYDINKNKGRFDQTFLTEELLQQIAGTTDINAVPADGSITDKKIANKAVTPFKTDFFEPTRNLFHGEYRNIFMATNSGVMQYHYNLPQTETSNTAVISVKSGTQYTVKVHGEHDVLRIATINGELAESGNTNNADDLILNSRGTTEYTFTTSNNARLLMVQTSETDQRPALQIEEGGEATEYTLPYKFPAKLISGLKEIPEELEDDVDELKGEISKIFPKKDFELVQGGLSVSSGTVLPSPGDSPTRLVLPDFISLQTGDKIIVNDGYGFSIAKQGGTRIGSWSDANYTVDSDDEYIFMVRKNDNSNISPVEGMENVKIESFDRVARISDIARVSEIKYVTINGNDDNSGNSKNQGLATLKKALDLGAKKVYMERGIYKESLSAAVEELTILPINEDATDPYEEPRQNITFLGADEISEWESFEGVYRVEVDRTYPQYNEVFIDRSLPLETTNNRPQYNAILWESSNLKDDYVMEPVLTVEEVKAAVGRFSYDGTHIYMNPQNIDNNFYAPYMAKGLDLKASKRVHLEDVTADYYLREGLDLDRIVKLTGQNCQSNHSAYADGVSLDYTNVKFTNCKAYKNRNDGFNLHFYGDSEFINCIGECNYDDGISHHEHCTGVVIGGSYSFNTKAGSAPVQGAKVNHYNVKFEGNDIGLLNSRAGDDNISGGNLYKENRVAISSSNSGELTSLNDKFVGNETNISTNGIVNEY